MLVIRTLHSVHCEGWMTLHVCQLILKVHWNVTLQADASSAALANRCGFKGHVARKAVHIQSRVGMDGNQNVLFILD